MKLKLKAACVVAAVSTVMATQFIGCSDEKPLSAAGQEPGTLPSPQPSSSISPGPSGTPATQSLYDKYGGAATIQKVVDDTATALLADCSQNPYFTTVLGTPGHDSVDRLKSCLDLQFTALFGGPATYPGTATSRADSSVTYACEDMVVAHQDIGIPPSIFDEFITIAAGVLKADGVSDEDIAAVAPTLMGLKAAVVAPDASQVTFNYTPDAPVGNGCTTP